MVQYVVRSGGMRSSAESFGAPIIIDNLSDVSINVAPENIVSMVRSGNNLVIYLNNGESVTLNNFFVTYPNGQTNTLFLSSNGKLYELDFNGDTSTLNGVRYNEVAMGGNESLVFSGESAAGQAPAVSSAKGSGIMAEAEVLSPSLMGGSILGGGGGEGALALVGGILVAGAAGAGGGGGGGSSDIVAPVAPVVEGSGTTKIYGTGEPGAKVQVDVNGDGIPDFETVVDENGNWVIDYTKDKQISDTPLTIPLADGTIVTVTQVDAAGNTSPPADTGSSTVDGTAPDGPVITQSSGTKVSGTAEPGSTIEIDVDGDGKADYTTTADENGNWSVTYDPALADGTAISVTATDPAGNTSGASTETADATAPDAPKVTESNANGIKGTGEPGATIDIMVDTDGDGTPDKAYSTTVKPDGTWEIEYDSPLPDGAAIAIEITDSDGNKASGVTVASVDAVPPTAPVVEVSNANGASGTGEKGTTISIDVDGDGVADFTTKVEDDGTWSIDYGDKGPLADGTVIAVISTDANGNSTAASGVIKVDAAAPDLAGAEDTFVAGPLLVNGGPGVSGKLDPSEAGAIVTVTLPDGTKASGTVQEDGSFSIALPAGTSLPHGAELTISAVDVNGNSTLSGQTVSITFDGQAATLSNVDINGLSVIMKSSEAATLQVEVNGTVKTDTTQTLTGQLQTVNFDAGTYAHGDSIRFKITDSAGNVSWYPSTGTATVDLQALDPEVTIANSRLIEGTAEPGADVTVTLNQEGADPTTVTVKADANGEWSFQPSQFGFGTTSAQGRFTDGATFTVSYVDAALNESGTVNAEVSTIPVLDVGADGSSDGYSGIAGPGETVVVAQVNLTPGTGGGVDNYDFNSRTATADEFGDWAVATKFDNLQDHEDLYFSIETGVNEIPASDATSVNGNLIADPDNTYLMMLRGSGTDADTVINVADEIGRDNQGDNATSYSYAFSQLDIGAIDLSADASNGLVLTESSIKALHSASDTLRVDGVDGNKVEINTAFTKTGSTTINGEDYDIYEVGSAKLIVDQDVDVS